MSRLLAIDCGLRRVGIAVTDPERIIASPLITISPQEVIPFLKKYCNEETVDKIIIGFPADVAPKESIVLAIKKFYTILKGEMPNHNIILYDERFTSKIAFNTLKQLSNKKKKCKENLDKMSAAILLESYRNKENL